MKHIKVFEDFKNIKPLNEAMALAQYYRNSDREVKDIAKQIDAIIDTADFVVASSKDKLLDLITDLTDAYLADMRDEE